MLPKVSIIIAAYNAQDTMGPCLDSIMRLDYPKDKLEVIVVDNNSQDSSLDIIRRYPVECEIEKKRFLGAVRNRGILKSKGEFVAFVDVDCIVDKSWLSNLIGGFDNSNIGGCAGKVLSYQPESLSARYMDQRGVYSQEKAFKGKKGFAPFLMSCNAIFPRYILEEINYFDESLGFLEDADLSWRITSKGYKLKIVPDALVYHIHKTNLRDFVRKFFGRGYGLFYFFYKYKKTIKLHLIFYEEIKRLIHEGINCFVNFPLDNVRKKNNHILFSILDIIKDSALILGFFWGFIFLFIKSAFLNPRLWLPAQPINH